VSKRKINKIDRTTRLLVTITLFSGAWFLLKGVFFHWLNTFTDIIYSKGIFYYEHLISIVLLTIAVAITLLVIRYLYMELRTYRYYKNEEEQQDSLKKADICFDEIFNMIKTSLYVLLFIIIGLICIKYKMFLLIISIGFLLGIILRIIDIQFNNEYINKAKLYWRTINEKAKYIIVLVNVSCLSLVIGFVIMISSYEDKQKVHVKFLERKNLSFEIKLSNIQKPEVEINVFRELKPNDDIKLNLEEEDFRGSFIEVSETSSMLKNNEKDKFHFSQNNFQYLYESVLDQYILDGKNELEIFIRSNGNISKKTVHIFTTIIKDSNGISISQKNFEVNP
jgi:hypothetical protein